MWWLPLLAPIVGGTSDDADVHVVALVKADTLEIGCSGTLVTDRVVLTAAHCAVQDDPAAYRVAFGPNAEDVRGILDARGHPAWLGTEVNDVAAILIDRTPVAPATRGTGAPATVRIVGYGKTNIATDVLRRREGTSMVTSSSTEALVLGPGPSLPCNGDSGGAVFAPSGELVGVISRGDAGCTMYAKASRVDANRTFIDAYIADTAAHARNLGERCLYDEHCASESCVAAADDPVVHYCSQACTKDSECADGMRCDDRACRYPAPTPGALGAPCTANPDCVHGTCESGGFCTVRCVSAQADCPAHFTCERAGGIDFFCTPADEGGGCCDASGGSGAGSLLLALGVLLGCRRR